MVFKDVHAKGIGGIGPEVQVDGMAPPRRFDSVYLLQKTILYQSVGHPSDGGLGNLRLFAHFASGQRPVFADAVHHGLCVVFTEIKRFVTCKPCFHFFALLPSLLLSQAVAGSHGRKNGPQLLYPSILQSESAKQAARQTEEYPASAQLGRILKAEKHITCCAVPRLLRLRQAGNWP